MSFPTLYITGFDDTTTQDEIVEVLSMSCPCLAQYVLAPRPLAVSSQTSLPTSMEHSLCMHVTFRDSVALVRFLDAPSTTPHLTSEVIGAVLALNGSKVVPRRCMSSVNSWSLYGLQIVLEPSHFGALSQYPSLKSLADAYPPIYSRYLPLDPLNGPRSVLSGQRAIAPSNRAMFATNSPLPPTPEVPGAAHERPLSNGPPQSGRVSWLSSTHPLVPASATLLSAEYEDQGMEGNFQASRFFNPEVSSIQVALGTLEAQPTDPTAVSKVVAYLRGQLHTIEGAYAKTRQTLEVADVELVRQNTEYMSVLGQLSEERKMHKSRLDEMRETFTRKLQDAEQRAGQAERLAKDAREALDAFKNDDRDTTRLLRDAKFHERQCEKAGKRRQQAEAELKRLEATYKLLYQEHERAKAELALAKEADQDLAAGNPPSCLHVLPATKDDAKLLKDELVTTKGALAAATQQLEQARAENQASTNQLIAANARVMELKLELNSSEHDVATKTNELKISEQRLISLSHNLADTRHAMSQAGARAQAEIQELEGKCFRSTELYDQALDAKAAATRELEKARLDIASAASAANAQLAEHEATRAMLLEDLKVEREAAQTLKANISNLKTESQRLVKLCEERERENSVLQSDYIGTLQQNGVLTQDIEKSRNVTTLLQERLNCLSKQLKAAIELVNKLQEEKGDAERELKEECRRFNELHTVHRQAIDHAKDLGSKLADRNGEINRLQGLQATVLAELAVTQGELSCEKAKATSISNEIDEKQAMIVNLQLSLRNEREVGRILEGDHAVERTKRRELEAELIESREKVKASEEDKEKLQSRLDGVFEVKQRLETKVKIAEAAGDSLVLDILSGIQAYEATKKRPSSDVLDIGSPRQPTKRQCRNRSSSEASVAVKEEEMLF